MKNLKESNTPLFLIVLLTIIALYMNYYQQYGSPSISCIPEDYLRNSIVVILILPFVIFTIGVIVRTYDMTACVLLTLFLLILFNALKALKIIVDNVPAIVACIPIAVGIYGIGRGGKS